MRIREVDITLRQNVTWNVAWCSYPSMIRKSFFEPLKIFYQWWWKAFISLDFDCQLIGGVD